MSDLQQLFDSFEPKYSKQNFYNLEKNIVENKKDVIIYKWNDVIILNGFLIDICKKHNLNYKIREKNFESKTEAIKWKMEKILEMNISNFQKTNSSLIFAEILSLKKYELTNEYKITRNNIDKTQFINKHATEEQIEIMENGGITFNKLYLELKKIEKGIQPEVPISAFKEFTDGRKRCTKCHEVKKANEFYKNKNSCKECDEKRKKTSLVKDIKGNVIKINDNISVLAQEFEDKIQKDLYNTEKDIVYNFSDMKEELNEIINYFIRNANNCFEAHKDIIKSNKYEIYTLLCNMKDEIDKIRRSFL